MSDIKLDQITGDIEIIEGNLFLTSGADAVRQHLQQRLRTFLGEWFLDQTVGVPYFQHVLVKNPNPTVIDAIFKSETLNTPGFLELLEFDLDAEPATRETTLSLKGRSTEGEIAFSELLGVIG